MFEELFRTLMPPQGRDRAFTPEEMAGFEAEVRKLPAAPSGNFFQVPTGSPDRQAGQLLPLTNGQPTPVMAKGLGFPSVWGAQQTDIPRGVPLDVPPLSVQTAPPAAVTKGVMPDGASSTPKDAFTTLMNLSGAPIQFRNNDAPLALGDSRTADWMQRSGRQFDPSGREIETQAGRQAMASMPPAATSINPGFASLFPNAQPGPASPQVAPGSPEDVMMKAEAFRQKFIDEHGGRGHLAMTDAGRNDPNGQKAYQTYLGLAQMQAQAADRAKLQQLENQGRADIAGIQSRSAQFGELDKSELHIRDAVGKGLLDKQTGQAMIDTINARRSSIGAGPGGAAGMPAPGQGGGAAGSTMSPPISAGADVNNLRSLFGQVGPTGQFAANPAAATGQTFSQLIDKIDPSMSPQVVAAIRSGQFGDPTAIKNAAYNALAQNYMMSQGPMPGGQTAAADLVNGGRGGQIPGRYTVPYGPQNKPLLDLIASPPSNVVDSVKKKAGFAQSGVPYDMIQLPDGTKIPFDQTGVQGISNMSSTLGYNQGARTTAQQRLSKLAQLVEMLQSTQPPSTR